ncbi:MAG: hypothetical protein WA140_02540 [Geobacteraceae bacterium]
MSTLVKMLFLIPSAMFLLAPVTAFCLEAKNALPIIELLQSGSAMISSDKKSIVDENGDIIAKETSNTIEKKSMVVDPNPLEVGKEALANTPKVIFCNKKCGMIEKHCYQDTEGNIVCVNICEKEVLICD